MVKGGYQIIDFNGIVFEQNTPFNIPNIYDKIEGTSKAILLSGFNVDGVDYRDAMCVPIFMNTDGEISYAINVFGYIIYIDDSDNVTVETEVLSTDWDLIDPSWTVSTRVYNRFTECLYGNFSTFNCKYKGNEYYCTVIGASPVDNKLYIYLDGSVRTILLGANNRVEII